MKVFFSSLLLLAAIASTQAQWRKVPVPTTASLRGLSAASGTVWASGTQGTVIRSGDDGKTWSVMTVPGAEKLDFRGIHAFDANSAVMISSGPAQEGQARIYHTSDGGKSWTQVYQEKTPGVFFDAIAFWDRKHGIVLSDPVEGHFALFITGDGGVTWTPLHSPAMPPALANEGAFAASNSCLTVQGEGNVWFSTGGAQVARVFHSNDRGRTWSVAETPLHPKNASSGIFSLGFQDDKIGVAAGGDYAHPESSDLSNLLLTSDGGRTWRAAYPTDPAGLYLSSVTFFPPRPKIPAGPIRAAGITGLYFGSITEPGTSWARESVENLNTIIYDKNGSWAVGPKGTVLRQNDSSRSGDRVIR
jgi:photosystem II stability/assembly factor-like uncharacterized protein